MNRYTHLGVYGILKNDNKVLLIKKSRGPHKGKWDLPGGSIEFGEEPYAALQREFLEETGIGHIVGRIRSAVSYTIIYPYRDEELEHMHHIGILYDVSTNADPGTIKIGGDGQDSLGARWFEPDEIKKIETTPFVKEIGPL
ncbi:NUDIX hydrolase [Paenibacillus sp. GCM10012303]|jgi:8-oxo-dGTP pyrophosphatase MutT (NUDIX family)|uniref:NUDIX hydrolase n=1 Tax=Paenibacillus sp. GCM10012303 TaxID=3317340 RepID=UPI003610FBD7